MLPKMNTNDEGDADTEMTEDYETDTSDYMSESDYTGEEYMSESDDEVETNYQAVERLRTDLMADLAVFEQVEQYLRSVIHNLRTRR